MYNHINVKVGTTSINGNASSINVIAAATLPFLPLYNLVIKYADNGAQTISVSSPNPGKTFGAEPRYTPRFYEADFLYLLFICYFIF